MLKRVSVLLALALLLTSFAPFAMAEEMTDVGTPRAQTLIVEPDGGVNLVPGQFNPYVTGTPASWGMHQLMWSDGLWDVNTMSGETIPTVAAELATPNEDYTEWTIKIREGLKWTDGETFDANDVVYTLNLILTIPEMNDHGFYNSLFSGCELVDDYTLKVFCHNPYTRIMTTLGVNTWGCGFRPVPEHLYSQQENVMSFMDSEPVFSGPYVLKDYDELGTWVLYEKRADWEACPTGMMYDGASAPQYVLYRVFGSGEARVMAGINNECDVFNEVSYEDLQLMMAANPNMRGWYEGFPYANTDDACAKGAFFNCGIEPFDNIDVRWALTLCCDWIEVSENIFEGIGRMSALQIPAVSAQVEMYYKPLSDWLTNEFALADGYNPWNPDFALELVDALVEDFGYELDQYSDDELKDIFGIGYWKTDVEKATELLEATEGFELRDGKWYYNDAPWKIEMLVHPEEASTQASRSGKAIADQWAKFGIEVEVFTLTETDLNTRVDIGDFMVASRWDACSGYVQDFYNNITGWNDEVYNFPVGEKAQGISSMRFYLSDPETSAEISAIVRDVATMDPKAEETREALTEWLKLTTAAHSNITVHAGTKIVPINTTYWTNFPTAENPYEGPWWWWSLMRFIVAQLEPVAQ